MRTVFYGEDLLGEHYPMLTYSYTLAALYASLGEHEKALTYLETSFSHVKAFEAYDETAKHTSIMQKTDLLCRIIIGATAKNRESATYIMSFLTKKPPKNTRPLQETRVLKI